jgi:ectoine hydroxylase-related dioxygenase (phytanoyl-CoA dioxygenase family)
VCVRVIAKIEIPGRLRGRAEGWCAMPSQVLTEAQLASLQKDGFVAVDSFVDQTEVNRLRAMVAGLYETEAGFREGSRFDLVGLDDGAEPAKIVQLLDAARYDRRLRRTLFMRKATAVARQVLGPGARLLSDHLVIKPPDNDQDTPPHQDEAYRDPNFGDREISVWLALQPVDERNGCMAYLPGSHLTGVRPHRHLNGDSRIHALECADPIPRDAFVQCPLPAGGCTVHTARTVHWSGPNHTAATRYAYVAIFDAVRVTARASYFEWNRAKDAEHMARQAVWLSRGGRLAKYLRRLRHMRPRDLCREVLHRLRTRAAARARRGLRLRPPQPELT